MRDIGNPEDAGFQLWRLLLAVACVQAVFWIVINPSFIQFKSDPAVEATVQWADITSVGLAEIATPGASGLDNATFHDVTGADLTQALPGYYALRTTVNLPAPPDDGLALLMRNVGTNYAVFVNGKALFSAGDFTLPDVSHHGLTKRMVHVPVGTLKTGENRIDTVEVFDYPREVTFRAPIIGDFDAVARLTKWKRFLSKEMSLLALVVGLVVALLALIALVVAEKRDLLFWLVMLSTTWSVRGLFYQWHDMPLHRASWFMAYTFITMLMAASWPIFVDAWSGRPKPWFRILVLGAALCGTSWSAWWLFLSNDPRAFVHVEAILDQLGLVIMAAALARLVWHIIRVRDTRYWELALISLLAMLMALFLFNSLIFGRYIPFLELTEPLFLLAFTVAFLSRNVRLFQSSAQMNALLQSRLDVREAELAAAHAHETLLVRRQAHDDERRSIMRDMHDGLGSQLMSMLLAARRGKADPAQVAEGLQSVIDEMRLMLDSMDSVGESLSVALSTFRERVQSRVEAAGFRFDWHYRVEGDLPNFTPRETLQVFRILQEAVTNGLKHSDGKSISVDIAPGTSDDFPVQVRVIDDGARFAPTPGSGRGLANMHARATSIGARLAVAGEQAGTVVTLDLPARNVPAPP